MVATLKKYSLITLGSFVLAFGISEFLLQHILSIGGASGLATVIFSLTNISMGTLVLLINVPIFAIGAFSEGRTFLVRSIYGTLMLALALQLMQNFPLGEYDIFLSAIYGGTLAGIGIGIALIAGGTTGGTDILAKVISKKNPALSLGTTVLLIDAFVITLAVIFFGNLSIGLYSAIALFLCTKAIDYITQGLNFAKAAFIISDSHEKISCEIHKKMIRGVTALYGKGTYAGKEKNILLCTVPRLEISRLKKLVATIDSQAFIIFVDAHEVHGQGFTSQS